MRAWRHRLEEGCSVEESSSYRIQPSCTNTKHRTPLSTKSWPRTQSSKILSKPSTGRRHGRRSLGEWILRLNCVRVRSARAGRTGRRAPTTGAPRIGPLARLRALSNGVHLPTGVFIKRRPWLLRDYCARSVGRQRSGATRWASRRIAVVAKRIGAGAVPAVTPIIARRAVSAGRQRRTKVVCARSRSVRIRNIGLFERVRDFLPVERWPRRQSRRGERVPASVL